MIPEGTDFSLYFITDTGLAGGPERLPHVVHEAVLGGAGVVQIRDKHASDAEFLELAAACVESVRRAERTLGRPAQIFVNDRVEVAAELGLHLHVGQSDAALAEARRAVGPDRMVGVSVSCAAELERAVESGLADLVGLGPVWATPTKPDAAAPLGPSGVAELARAAHAADLVAVAIGGVNQATLPELAGAPVDGVCVVSAIAAAENPRARARELRKLGSRYLGLPGLPSPSNGIGAQTITGAAADGGRA